MRRRRGIALVALVTTIGIAPVRSGAAVPGALDPTFGVGGTATTAIGSGGSRAQAVALQSDGKIVVAGTVVGGLMLARYDQDGTLDPSFGESGVVTVASRARLASLTIQPDDEILLVGSDFEFGVARYDADGAPDSTFGNGGRVSATALDMRVYAAALQPDGRIVLAGNRRIFFSDYEMDLLAVARLEPGGTLDPSFGVGGSTVTDVQCCLRDDSWAVSAIVQPDRKIVAVGGSGIGFSLVRYDEDGVRDGTFGLDGIVTTAATGGARTAVPTDDDAIVVAGDAYFTGNAFLTRYRSDGALDPSFGDGGRVAAVLPDGTRIFGASGLARQADGKLVVAAETPDGARLLRYETDGALDCRFGIGGVVSPGLTLGDFVQAIGVTLQNDGRIVAAAGRGAGTHGVTAVTRHEGGDGEPRCGDCTVDPGEACDDGNASASDACKPDCTPNVCGDGLLHTGVEACDDGARNGAAGGCCTSSCVAAPDTTPCDDGLLCTVDDQCRAATCGGAPRICATCEACDPVLGCVGAPRAACRQAMSASASLLLRTDGTGGRPDRVAWRWRKGERTFPDAFGDPLRHHAYAFCVYEGSAHPEVLLGATAPPGGLCGRRACWRSPRTGRVDYRDRSGAADGVTAIVLRAGLAGRASAIVRQRGGDLLPPLPLTPPLLVQLQAGNGECWEATYSAAGVRRNDATAFRAVAD